MHGRNVLARLKINKDAKQEIVIGAHVDHLGHGEMGGVLGSIDKNTICPGADDNASGVASVLVVAKHLAKLKSRGELAGNKNILFAIWSGEELGVLGSSHFVKHKSNNIEAAINLDMVGHLRDKLLLQGTGSSVDWQPILTRIVKQPFAIDMQSDPYLPTDAMPFYLQGVPVLNLFTGAHENYHTPGDTAETLNYQGMQQISNFLSDLVMALEERTSKMHYRAVANNRDYGNQAIKVYLGTIPDYASENVIGVKLAGVIKNSPAEQAGLKQDDIIIELASEKIRDIYAYTKVLNSLPIAIPVKLLVKRGNKNVSLKVIAQKRN